MSSKFEKAAAIVQSLPKDGPVKPSQEDQLKFYSLYKQVTIGDCDTTRPGMLDFVGKAKWDAWNEQKGKSKAEAEAEYVSFFKDILATNGSSESKEYIKEIDAA
ncbi:hypothetical protein FRB94_000231 [Tulasnella sp. JGI-2019a]|nr:hypothetical protein FRB94_000231 [Tulasnella sp. JGI-2019a]KAG9015312.1 hypothetical protein FRB93_013012 [Tulasnella sp. JGI-2019a]KAG9039384.1 hypothetical protein FRB95_010672 [Tulasnella sp. JGI-2019a]